MGFLKNVAGAVLGPVGDIIGAKYNADLQGHLNDRAAAQNYTLARDTALINEAISQRAFKEQKSWDLEMWEKDKAYQEDLWNRQNEYNAPAAQMARLKEAGLNPMLMYDMGTPGNATIIPAADPNVSRINVPAMSTPHREVVYTKVGQGLGGSIVEGILKYMQIKNIGLDNEIKAVQESLMRETKRKAKADADLAEYETDLTKKSGVSGKDWSILRLGGRLLDWMRRRDWDSTNEDVKKGKFVFPKEKGGD